MVKFIHAADLHLDSPFLGLTNLPANLLNRVRQSTFTAAQAVFDRAVNEQVDFVILAGDLFDRQEQSVAAQAFLFLQFDRLRAAQIPVIICFGNHDFASQQPVAYPDNVTVLAPHGSTKTLRLADGETVAISGFSYDQRWVTSDPITTFPQHGAVDWHIGVWHGAVKTGGVNDHYAPFTVAELQDQRYDYWALGHIHRHQLLASQPPIVYAGNPQGRSINETGERGAYLVTSQGSHLVPTFFATADLLWQQVDVTSSMTSLAELSDFMTTWLGQHAAQKFTLTNLTIRLTQPLGAADQVTWDTGDWLTLYQRTHRRDLTTAQRYFCQVVLQVETAANPSSQLDDQYWQTGGRAVFTAENLQQQVGKLTGEPALATWLQQEQTLEELQTAATERLNQLIKGGNHDVP